MFEKKQVWWIECCTGCSCCAHENFDSGFYFEKEEAQSLIDNWSKGIGNPLCSQYAKYGHYYLHSTEAEMLPDGRMIVDDHVFSADEVDCPGRICW